MPSAGENKEERRRLQYSDTARSAVNSQSGHPRNRRKWVRRQAVFEVIRIPSKRRGYFLSHTGTFGGGSMGSRGNGLGTGLLPLLKRREGWGGNSSRICILLALAAAEEQAERGRRVEESEGAAAEEKKVTEPVS